VPELECPDGAFVWSQPIDRDTGAPLLTRLKLGVPAYTLPPGSFPSAFDSAVRLTFTNAISYDAYENRDTRTQPNERWRVVVRQGGDVVDSTVFTPDLADMQEQANWVGGLGSIDAPNGVDGIVLQHWSVANPADSNPNSVVPAALCVTFEPYHAPPRCKEDHECFELLPDADGCAFKCKDFRCVREDNDANCHDDDPCTSDVCRAGVCENEALPAGTACEGKDWCAGTCDSEALCVCPPTECPDDGDKCTMAVLNDFDECTTMPVNCDDSNVCTDDSCDSKEGCLHDPIPVDDQDECTLDYCDPIEGIKHAPVVCEAQDKCHVAVCNPLQPGLCEQLKIDCDAIDPENDRCTINTCDPDFGCRSEKISGCEVCEDDFDCEDNDVCTLQACNDGVCAYSPALDCDEDADPLNLCERRICHPTHGCVTVERECPANLFLKYYSSTLKHGHAHDTLQFLPPHTPACEVGKCIPETGECTTEPLECGDGDRCTVSYCDASTNQCMHHERSCPVSDECHESFCTTNGGCQERPILVTDPNACQLASCVPGDGIVFADRNCTDSDLCTLDDCHPLKGCTHTPKDCSDDNKCTVNERCRASDGKCVSKPVECEQPEDQCKEAVCDPHEGCVVRDKFCPPSPDLRYLAKCNPLDGECVNVLKDCDDLDPCTADRVRPNGDCAHELIDSCCRANDDCPPATKCLSFFCDLNFNTCAQQATQNCCAVDADCDDGLSCTEDHCQRVTGTCFNEPIKCPEPLNDACKESECSEEHGGTCITRTRTCDDDNACTRDQCEPSTGKCINEPVIKCTDGNLCTTDRCNPDSGECEFKPCDCDDYDPCTLDTCDPTTGDCHYEPLPDIDDGDECTIDTCRPRRVDPTKPLIEHTPRVCDDGMLCTIDTCNSVKGCIFTPKTFPNIDTDICFDVTCNPMTGNPVRERIRNCCHADHECHALGERCTDEYCDYNTNRCVFSPKPNCCNAEKDCADDNKCTVDSCKLETGECCHEPIECEAPDACHVATCHPDRGCVIEPLDCADEDPCTVDTCRIASATGDAVCDHTPLECEQPEELCVPQNVCVAGECVAEERAPCDDEDPCTDDVCEEPQFKFQAAKPQCTHTPCDCRDTNPCTVDTCDPATGECLHKLDLFGGCCTENSDCDDLNRCTKDWCNTLENKCHSEPIENCCFSDHDCKDENECTLNEYCDLKTNQCVLEQKECDDCNECTEDRCEPTTGECQHRSSVDKCDDHDRCTNDFCDAWEGCYHEPVQCDLNAGPCQEAVCSNVQGCITVQKDCDDDNFCTIDSCSIEQDGECVHEERDCDDGNPCTLDSCDSRLNKCVHRPVQCGDPNDKCNVHTCDAVAGCTSTPRICHDADACTTGQCVEGVGCVYEQISCDDGNRCTHDYCDSGKYGGCRHEPKEHCCKVDDDCDDGKECTTDTCVAGLCHYALHHTAECDKGAVWHKFNKQDHIHSEHKAEAKRKAQMAPSSDCGNGVVEDGEECDGPSGDGFFTRCNDDCELRVSTTSVVLVVLAALLGLCACLSCVCCFVRLGGKTSSRRRRMRR